MRVVSAAFLSAGIVQFAGVIIVLFTYGPRIVEDSSPLCAVAIYFIAAIGGVLTSAIMSPDTIAVASSAGAFGLLGATWVDYTIYFRGTAAVALLVAITCANVFVGLMPFVDNWCHISAFCLGSLLWSSFLANRFVNEGAVGTWGMSLKFAQVWHRCCHHLPCGTHCLFLWRQKD